MKNLMIILSAALAFSACQQSVDVEKEKEAIKAVIEKSGEAYVNRDYNALTDAWVHDESATRVNVTPFNYGITETWENQDSRYKTSIENNPDPFPFKQVFSNWRIKVYADNAVVLVDKKNVTNEGDSSAEALHSYNLDKIGGEWKISNISTIMVGFYDEQEENLAISETYHKLNPDDVDNILTDDFIGRDEIGGTWTKDGHKNFWTNNKGTATDSIIYQLPYGNAVTTMFKRKGTLNGEKIEGEALQIKRFVDGKIAEIWEYGFGVYKQ
ncbi:MAG: hypothetical protein ACFHWX_12565 [Bacteroidota bacterium]